MKNDSRKFGLIVGGICLFIFSYKLFFHHPNYIFFGYIGGVLILAALLKPMILNPLRILWDKIGVTLGIINSHIILFLCYFLLITPISIIMRFRKKDSLALKKQFKDTYWQPIIVDNSSFKQQF